LKFDDAAINAAMGTRPPATFDRAGRVRLIGEAARALVDGNMPDRDAALFLGGALLAWLESGGDLSRDFLKITKAKSRHTAAYLWRQFAHQDEGADSE
jgi:hypothetical protein